MDGTQIVLRREVIEGDCLGVLAREPERAFDCCVTDPPYGLGFMGKQWDHGVPGVAFWREHLRVLKPGAHLLAFGGTRTFHRLAVAIEDAGFEIRDCIMYVYGSGFPKSLNIGCKCGRQALPYTHNEGTESTPQCDVRPVRNGNVSPSEPTAEEPGKVLFAGMSEQGAPPSGAATGGGIVGAEKPGVEGRGDVPASAGELRVGSIRAVPGGIPGDGEAGRVRDGTPVDGRPDSRAVLDAGGVRTPSQPRPARQSTGKPRPVRHEPGSQVVRGEGDARPDMERCPKCGGIIERTGFGTALKPAWEPIIVARKPLIGTVAANVAAYGTGAINIDACRVPGNVEEMEGRSGASTQSGVYLGNIGIEETWKPNGRGRFPANLIHDGSDDVEAEFAKAGVTTSPGKVTRGAGRAMAFGMGRQDAVACPSDTGTPSRFFYCAKASKADRGEGNDHPTVKPTALMRYLCRLVCPPGGVVLDAFAGSGSTLKAARAEGFGFVGVEVDPHSVEIARRRAFE